MGGRAHHCRAVPEHQGQYGRGFPRSVKGGRALSAAIQIRRRDLSLRESKITCLIHLLSNRGRRAGSPTTVALDRRTTRARTTRARTTKARTTKADPCCYRHHWSAPIRSLIG